MKLIPLLALLLATGGLAAPPNIVFIMTDQQAADALSCRMGDRYVKTPAMDALAARGTFFTRAYSPNPLCIPARNSIFTGRYPHETGITDNSHTLLDAAEFPSLGTLLQRAGYATAYYGKWHLGYDRENPATHGFTTLKVNGSDAEVAQRAASFIAGPHDRPFLLVASFLNPHDVCELARGERLGNGPIGEAPSDRSLLPPVPANLAPPRDEPDTMTLIRRGYHANRLFPVGNFSPLQWQALRWGYYRLIEKVDAEIGQVLAALRAAGLEENTVVIFTADHGECAGAHGMNQKTVLYEESARVPLIVSLPGQKVARTSDRLVNTGLDLLPTMLDCAQAPTPAQLTGASLRRLAAGEAVTPWRDHVVVENNMNQTALVGDFVPVTEGRMLRTERFKYCVYAHGEHRESLVDLATDPGETTNLARDAAYRTVLLEHRERLRQFGREHHDALVATLLADDVKPRPFDPITTTRVAPRDTKRAKEN